MPDAADDWCVLLVGGASGTGKSQVSHPMARRLGTSVLEVDDLVTALKAVTNPDQLPILHYWDTHPAAHQLPVPRIVELTTSVMALLHAALEAVIADHLDTGTRVIIEGDYLSPSLAVDRPGVRGVILHEPDLEQLVHNYAAREPGGGVQRPRAEVSAQLGALLSAQATALGVPVVAARPWSTVLDRATAALGLAPLT